MSAMAGNVMRQGPSTRGDLFAKLNGPGDLWFSDNLLLDPHGAPLPLKLDFNGKSPQALGIVMAEKAPLWPEGLPARPAAETAAWVLENAGARPWDRDAVDQRLIREAESGGGKIIDSESEAGGYEVLGK